MIYVENYDPKTIRLFRFDCTRDIHVTVIDTDSKYARLTIKGGQWMTDVEDQSHGLHFIEDGIVNFIPEHRIVRISQTRE